MFECVFDVIGCCILIIAIIILIVMLGNLAVRFTVDTIIYVKKNYIKEVI